jgi:hypothetical protein
MLHVVTRTVWGGGGFCLVGFTGLADGVVRVWEAGVSAGLLFRVGRMKDGWVVKVHQRWDWAR